MSIFNFIRAKSGQLDEEVAAYRRLAGLGYAPQYIIDVGAHKGAWTRHARMVFGHVPTLMIEPQEEDRATLDALCTSLPDTRLVPRVLWHTPGETVTFYHMAEGSRSGSSLKPERSDVPRIAVKHVTETLDRVADARDNIFLKIDAQGAELDILRGGEDTLARTTLIQLEVAVLRYNEGAPSMVEVLQFMDDRGFAPVDISGRSRVQGHLVQVDIIFAPAHSPLRKDFFRFAEPALA